MYTLIERRSINMKTLDETVKRAQTEAFPRMQAADGFMGFYLVTDEKENINTAIIVWESKEHSDKYIAASKDWWKALDDLGHKLETCNEGETTIELQPTK
jgi:quinol monooxygenase YgiN